MASTPIENQNIPLKGWHGYLQMRDPDDAGDWGTLRTIGWVSNVSLDVSNSSEAYFAIGDRVAKQTRRGQVELSGSIGRAFVDSSLIRLMFGQVTDDIAVHNLIDLGASGVSANEVEMQLQFEDKTPGRERVVRIILSDVILETFSLEYAANDNIVENLDYQAGDITIIWDGTIIGSGAGDGFEWANAAPGGPGGIDLPDLDFT